MYRKGCIIHITGMIAMQVLWLKKVSFVSSFEWFCCFISGAPMIAMQREKHLFNVICFWIMKWIRLYPAKDYEMIYDLLFVQVTLTTVATSLCVHFEGIINVAIETKWQWSSPKKELHFSFCCINYNDLFQCFMWGCCNINNWKMISIFHVTFFLEKGEVQF